MAFGVPLLVAIPNADGTTRYYWRPSRPLARSGWKGCAVPDADALAACTTQDQVLAAAITTAKAMNDKVEAWRAQGIAAAPKPAARKDLASATLSAAIERYKSSLGFKQRPERTRDGYLKELKIVEEWAGSEHVAEITRVAFEDFMLELIDAGRRGRARNFARMLRIVLNYCVAHKIGGLTQNIALKPGIEMSPPNGRIWPIEAVRLFVETADRMQLWSMGTAVYVNHWLGQREGDVITLKRAMLQDGKLLLRQSKTDQSLRLPLEMIGNVALRIDQELERRVKRNIINPHLICAESGIDYSYWNFQRVFVQVREQMIADMLTAKGWYWKQDKTDASDEGCWWHDAKAGDFKRLPGWRAALAGNMAAAARDDMAFPIDWDYHGRRLLPIKDLWFMHLRHTAVVRLATANVSPILISKITGHTLVSVNAILERYLVGTDEMVNEALRRRMEYERAKGTDF